MPVDLDPSPSPNGSPFTIGFRTPEHPPSSSLPSPTTSPEDQAGEGSPSLDGPGQDSALDWDDETFPESPADTSSPASTREPDAQAEKVDLFREEDLIVVARGGVLAAGEKAHEVLATTPGQRHVGLYLADEKDAAQIGDPLARIAARHQGVAGKVNPDTQDFLAAMVGVFSYGAKQFTRRAEARALDAGAGNPQPMPEAVDL